MKKILLATNNEHKAREYEEMLAPLGYMVVIPKELKLDFDPEETGATFRENAYLKAKAFYDFMDIPCIADDSGLVIPSLGGMPGIHTARYAKEHGGYPAVFSYLNKELEGKDRRANFHCCICYYSGGEPLYFEGDCPGYLLEHPVGENGFGYDPIFHSIEADIDFGIAPEEIKNRFSHRGKALAALLAYFKKS